MTYKNRFSIALAIAVLIIMQFACDSVKRPTPTPPPGSVAGRKITITTQKKQPGENIPETTRKMQLTGTVTVVAQPTNTRVPTKPLEEVDTWFGRVASDQTKLQFGVNLYNPNENYAITDVIYRMDALDADGNVLGSDVRYVWIDPNDTAIMAGLIGIPEGSIPKSLKYTEFDPGKPVPLNGSIPVELGKAMYLSDAQYPGVSAEFQNPTGQDLLYPEYAAVGYDASGEIIGVGTKIEPFLPANGRGPVKVPLKLAAAPAKVDVFFSPDANTHYQPPAAEKLEVGKAEVLNRSSTLSGAVVFKLKNPDPANMVYRATYIAAAYGADGSVLDVCSNSLNGVVYPGSELANVCPLYLPEGVQAARAEVQTLVTDAYLPPAAAPTNPIRVVKTELSDYQAIVTLKNTGDTELKKLVVWAIAYDDKGLATGYANYPLEALAAGSEKTIELGLYLGASKPASVEIFAVPQSTSFD